MTAVAIVAASACGKGKAPTAPATAPPPSGLPPLAPGEIKPSAAAANPHGAGADPHGMGADPHAAHGGSPHGGENPHGAGAPPLGEPATPGGIPFDEKSVILGSLQLPAEHKDKVKAGDTIFIVVRRFSNDPAAPTNAPGNILAVKKIDAAATFPQPFAIDNRDAMMAGTALTGKVVVSVRVDKDGNATTKNPGDVTGVSTVLEPPAKQVIIKLDKVL